MLQLLFVLFAQQAGASTEGNLEKPAASLLSTATLSPSNFLAKVTAASPFPKTNSRSHCVQGAETFKGFGDGTWVEEGASEDPLVQSYVAFHGEGYPVLNGTGKHVKHSTKLEGGAAFRWKTTDPLCELRLGHKDLGKALCAALEVRKARRIFHFGDSISVAFAATMSALLFQTDASSGAYLAGHKIRENQCVLPSGQLYNVSQLYLSESGGSSRVDGDFLKRFEHWGVGGQGPPRQSGTDTDTSERAHERYHDDPLAKLTVNPRDGKTHATVEWLFENSDLVIANFGAHYTRTEAFTTMMGRVLDFFNGGRQRREHGRLFLYRTSGTAHPHCCRDDDPSRALQCAKGEPVPYSVPLDRRSSTNASRVLELGAGLGYRDSLFAKQYHWELPYAFNELAGGMLAAAAVHQHFSGALVDVSEMSTQRPDLHQPNQWRDCLHYPFLGGLNWWWVAMTVNVLEGLQGT